MQHNRDPHNNAFQTLLVTREAHFQCRDVGECLYFKEIALLTANNSSKSLAYSHFEVADTKTKDSTDLKLLS
jgi:hypothetical protein